MLRRGDKITERVALVPHAAGVVPRLAKFASAADVRNGEDHAAVQKAQAIRIEADGHRESVASVTVQEQRSRSIQRRIAAVYERDWNTYSVGRFNMNSLALVLAPFISTKDR